MKAARIFMMVLLVSALHLIGAQESPAFWGFVGDDTGRSGLDFDLGYDRNTETTVRGRVVSVEPGEGDGPVRIVVGQGQGEIRIIAAPEWYWSDRGIPVKQNDEVEATGSKAQGKDGKLYLIGRTITNLTEHETVTLRDDAGRPGWRGGSRVGHGGSNGVRNRRGGGRR